MSNLQVDPLQQVETTCRTLVHELQIIWNEVGESESDRDEMLLELERDIIEVCRRKVDEANCCRAQLKQAIADSEEQLASICSAMGERPVHIKQSDQNAKSLKEELSKIVPQLEEMQKRKSDRKNQFLKVLEEIHNISNEIEETTGYISSMTVDDTDLSLRKLEELHRELHVLQKDKSDRLKEIHEHLNSLNSLCLVLGMDFKQTVSEVHPTLGDSEGSKSLSNSLIGQLDATIKCLREVKIQRMQKLQDLATTMLELWNLMDTPLEEQQMFQNVTCNIAASEHEVTEPNTLSVDFISHIAAEVSRLEELKSSKMKELVFKKRFELEEICRKTHLILESDSAMECAIEALESGVGVDPSYILEQIELQIAKVKEEAFSRKEILDKVEKWLGACDEECWLEEYNRDESRYNSGRGTHLALKRAEKARALVNKLPAMVDALTSKTVAWEKERGIEFTYDGNQLLGMLEEYTILRQEKEQERRRLRDQKKLQGVLIAEQEARSKPSPPMKPQSVNKAPRISTGGVSNKRIFVGGAMHQTCKPDSKTTTPQNSRPSSRKSERGEQNEQLINHMDDCFTVLGTATSLNTPPDTGET